MGKELMPWLGMTFLGTIVFTSSALFGDAQELTGQLTFANGDRISALPERLTEDGNLVLRAGELIEEGAVLHYGELVDLRLAGAKRPGPAGDHAAVLQLTNGDALEGSLVAVSEETVTFQGRGFPQMRFRQSMCEGIEIKPVAKALYTGPDSLDNWTVSGDGRSWTLKGGRFLSSGNGSLARKFELPGNCRIAFTLSWNISLKGRILLFADAGAGDNPKNCYELLMQRRFLYLRKRWSAQAGGGARSLGQAANVRELADKNKVRIEFFCNRMAGNLAMYVEGRQVQVWTDAEPEVGVLGNWIHFVSEEYPLAISDLTMSAWDGELPADAEPDDQEEEAKLRDANVQLADGSEVEGTIGGVVDGMLLVRRKDGAEQKIPLGTIRYIPLAGSKAGVREEPRRYRRDIRGLSVGGGRLTFELQSIDGDILTGRSQAFGEAEFNLGAFSRIDFNIYDEDLNRLRNGW